MKPATKMMLMVLGVMGSASVAAGAGVPRAVTIAGAAEDAAAGGAWAWPGMMLGLIAAGTALVVVALAWWWWTRRDGLEQAWVVLALRLGLKRSERRLVRVLARGGTPAAALLLSERALERAIEARRATGEGIDERAAAGLRRRVLA